MKTIRTYDLVIIVSLLWFMIQFLRFVFPPLFETFQEIYGVTNTQTGILFTTMMLAYASIQFPAGVFGDRIGRPIVILTGAMVFSGAALLAVFSPNFLIVFVAAILIGLATGPHKAVAIPLLSNQYPSRTGRALGVMDTIGQFGGLTAPLVVVVFLGIAFWQGVFIIGAILSIVLSIVFYVQIRGNETLRIHESPMGIDSNSDEGDTNYVSVFADRDLLIFMIIAMLSTFAWYGISSFFPLFIATEKGISNGNAGILYSLLFAASISQTVTGDLSDRVGRLYVGLLLFGAMFVGITTLLFVNSLLTLIVVTLLMGVGFHGFRPVRDSYLMDVIPDDIGGGTLGVVRTGMTAIGALAPAIIGYLADTVGFKPAFAVIGVAVFIGGILLYSLQ